MEIRLIKPVVPIVGSNANYRYNLSNKSMYTLKQCSASHYAVDEYSFERILNKEIKKIGELL